MKKKLLFFYLMFLLAIQAKAQIDSALIPSNFSPLNLGNKYQYYTYSINSPTSRFVREYSIEKDTIINGNKYYLTDGVWLRVDSTGRLFAFVTSANEDKLIMDFNWEPDQRVISGVTNIYGDTIPWKGLGYDTDVRRWAYGIGKYYHYNITDFPGTPEILKITYLIQMIKNENDTVIYYSHNYYPEIVYNPPENPLDFILEINFQVNHYFSFFQPPYNTLLQFIDEVKIESFYQLGDSIINLDTISILGERESPNFSTTINLDSSLFKEGFEFFYRIQAKDKGIIPHYAYSPDTGYYKIAYPELTGIFNYYPLAVGNKWIYNGMYNNWMFPSYITVVREIAGTEQKNNGKLYFKIIESGKFDNIYYERIDSLTEKIYRYDPDSTENNFEYLIEDLKAEPGDTIYSYRYKGDGLPFFESFVDTVLFNHATKIRNYKSGELLNWDYSLAQNFGIIYVGSGDDNRFFYYELTGAVINGNVFGDTTLVGIDDEKNLPTKFALHQNYPNPFNPTTKIKFTIPSSSGEIVTLKVFDILGNEIAALVNEEKPAGEYEVEFDAGKYNLSSGVYYYTLRTAEFSESKKMVLIR